MLYARGIYGWLLIDLISTDVEHDAIPITIAAVINDSPCIVLFVAIFAFFIAENEETPELNPLVPYIRAIEGRVEPDMRFTLCHTNIAGLILYVQESSREALLNGSTSETPPLKPDTGDCRLYGSACSVRDRNTGSPIKRFQPF